MDDPVFVIFVVVLGAFVYWVLSAPSVLSITREDIPRRWTIGSLLKLMAVVSVSLATLVVVGPEVAILFLLSCLKITVVALKSP